MGNSFQRPVGAPRDTFELEYISALHQTDKTLRGDGSISATDIRMFLMSRYGISVSLEDVQETILRGLGGGDDEEECVDLCELVAILLIPTLLRARLSQKKEGPGFFDNDEGPGKTREDFLTNYQYRAFLKTYETNRELTPDYGIMADVLGMILKTAHERIGTPMIEPCEGSDDNGEERAPTLTKELIRSIFEAYEEKDLVNDDSLITEMMDAAGGEGVPLDEEAFARALTDDVSLYDVSAETELTTHYYDVFNTERSTKESTSVFDVGVTLGKLSSHSRRKSDDDQFKNDEYVENEVHATVPLEQDPQHESDKMEAALNKQEIVTNDIARIDKADVIDYAAETYRSKSFVVVLWTCLIFSYYSYALNVIEKQKCTDKDDYGCKVGVGILNWVIIMGVLSICGSLFIGLSSMGNEILTTDIWRVAVGTGSVFFFTIFPFIVEKDWGLFDTRKASGDSALRTDSIAYFSLACGCVLLLLQCVNLARILVPDKVVRRHWLLTVLFKGGNGKAEFQIKQAATYKVNKMVANARQLHYATGDDRPSHGTSLLQYQKQTLETETVGGFLWTWKRFFSGSLFQREGVWFHARLYAGNVSQFFVTFIMLFISIKFTDYLLTNIYASTVSSAAFNTIDIDNNGGISMQEAQSFASVAEFEGGQVSQIFDKVGGGNVRNFFNTSAIEAFIKTSANSTNNFGAVSSKLSFDDFRKATLNMSRDLLTILDRDEDGSIDKLDIDSLVATTFTVGRRPYERKYLNQTIFSDDAKVFFWQFLYIFDYDFLGYPSVDNIEEIFGLIQGGLEAIASDAPFPDSPLTTSIPDTGDIFRKTAESDVSFDQYFFEMLVKGVSPAFANTTDETLSAAFSVLDRDNDGILSADDMIGVVNDVFNEGVGVFNRTKIEGQVKESILTFMQSPEIKYLGVELINFVFHIFDENCDGEITAKEAFIPLLLVMERAGAKKECLGDQPQATVSYYLEDYSYEDDDFYDDDDDYESGVDIETEGDDDYTYQQDDGYSDDDGIDEKDEEADEVVTSFTGLFVTPGLDSYVPEKWMLRLSFSLGSVSALLAGLWFTGSYVPSAVTTVLQYRSGVIPSLRSDDFNPNRASLDKVTMLFGSIFWGMFITSIAVFIVISAIVFILCWQGTRSMIVRLSAQVIGIIITILLKIVLVKILGTIAFAAFYRKRPTTANIAGLALECWHVGITFAFMIARAVQLTFASALFLGRIDKEFLAPDAKQIGPVVLDPYPRIFKQDILSADAHRHPYLERLGLMYMMKLRHGENFAKTSGSCWRLLFVFALMPWLRKYRVLSQPELSGVETVDEMKGHLSKAQEKISALQDKVAALVAKNEKMMSQMNKSSTEHEDNEGIERYET